MPALPNKPGDYSRERDARRAGKMSGDWITLEACEAVRKPSSDGWGTLATDWYNAFVSDPVGRSFTSADWAQAFIVAEVIDRADKAGTLHRGSTVETILAAMRSLGAGPVERQKARIQIVEAGQPDRGAQAALIAAQAMLELDSD